LQAGEDGVTAFAVLFALVEIVAFDVEIKPGEFVLVYDLLVGGFKLGRIVNDVGEFFSGLAAERHDDIAAAFADGINLVMIKVLLDGNAAVTRRFFVVNGIFAVAILTGNDEGERIIFEAALVVAIGKFEIITGANIHVRRENPGRPAGADAVGDCHQ
jgi:hypothetical protein